MSVDSPPPTVLPAEPEPSDGLPVAFSPRNIWRVGLVILGLVMLALLVNFIVEDGGAVIFTVLMSWFAAIAIAPAVNRLERRMPRGAATILVMIAITIGVVLFLLAFGALFLDQIVQIIRALPGLVDSAIEWANQRFGLTLDIEEIKESMNLTTEQATSLASQVGSQALGILGSVLGTIFGMFTFALFTFYLSADDQRLRGWVASLFPSKGQQFVMRTWDLTAEKTGGYVSARVILALINGTSTAIVFLLIGMPYWLALGIWTGIVAQFVPTIGTYIAIILPVIVGLLSPSPIVGVLALIWGLLYQQVENLTIEPRISAKAVNVHPAVAFGSVMLGAALFGVAGAFLAVPVTAMLLALGDIYIKRHEILPLVNDDRSSGAEDDVGLADGPATAPAVH